MARHQIWHFIICRYWHRLHQHDAALRDRMLAFRDLICQPSSASASFTAAIYPQAVAHPRLLAPPPPR